MGNFNNHNKTIKIMKRNLLLALASLLLGTASAFAQNTLNIHQKTGGVVSYSFSEKPVVTYTEDGIHLVTNSVEVDYPLSNLEKFTFEDNVSPSGIIRTEGGSSDVQIYSVGGTLVKTVKATDGVTTFSTKDLPAGIYVIKNGKSTYKIVKK